MKLLDILASLWMAAGVIGAIAVLWSGLAASNVALGILGSLLCLLVAVTIGASVQGLSIIVTYFAAAIQRQVRK